MLNLMPIKINDVISLLKKIKSARYEKYSKGNLITEGCREYYIQSSIAYNFDTYCVPCGGLKNENLKT